MTEADGGAFEAPPGYVRADTAHADAGEWENAEEIWVVRVPDGLDVRKLDGVTIPLDQLDTAASAPLANVRADGEDTFDVFEVRPNYVRQESEPSQLIDMAAPASSSRRHVFLEQDFSRSVQGKDMASELEGVYALLPHKGDEKLHMTPVSRHFYLARHISTKSGRHEGIDVAPPPKHEQPWDRLRGAFHPAGSLSAAPSSNMEAASNRVDADADADADAEAHDDRTSKSDAKKEKKRKKAGDDAKSKKKKKHAS